MPHRQFSAYQDWSTCGFHVIQRFNQSYHRIFPIFKFENRSRTTCSRFLQSFASPLWHSEHCLTIIVSSFYTQSGRTHYWWKPKERRCKGRTWNLFHIHQNCHLRLSQGNVLCRLSVKTGTTLTIVTLTIWPLHTVQAMELAKHVKTQNSRDHDCFDFTTLFTWLTNWALLAWVRGALRTCGVLLKNINYFRTTIMYVKC